MQQNALGFQTIQYLFMLALKLKQKEQLSITDIRVINTLMSTINYNHNTFPASLKHSSYLTDNFATMEHAN